MKYTVDKVEEVKSSKGSTYHRADLSQGEKLWVGVAIFGGFDNLVAGAEIEGTLVEKEWNGKPSYSLSPILGPKHASGGGFKQKMIEDTMDKKNKAISSFQDSKEYSIKVASTFTAAWNTAIAEYELHKTESLNSIFERWREYYWYEFDVTADKYPPFK